MFTFSMKFSKIMKLGEMKKSNLRQRLNLDCLLIERLMSLPHQTNIGRLD